MSDDEPAGGMDKVIQDAAERLRRYNADEENGFASVYEVHCAEWAKKLPLPLRCSVPDLAQAVLDADRELLADAYLAALAARPPAADDGEAREIITGWKEWHHQVRRAVGLKVNERTVTLETVKRLKESRDSLLQALDGLVRAVELDSREKGISGFTGARLSDARDAIAKALSD